MKQRIKGRQRVSLILCSGLFLLFLFAATKLASAQMFSVEGGEEEYSTPTAAVYVGLGYVDFKYTGSMNLPGNMPFPGDLPEPSFFEFSGPILKIKLETPFIDLSIGTGGSITGLKNNTYFSGTLKANYGFGIIRNERFVFEVPVQLTSSLTRVSTDVFSSLGSSQIEFRQTNIAPGAGVRLFGKLAPQFRMQVKAIPSYGFSTATGGSFSGSVFIVDGQARLYFDRIFNDIGISLGYDYNYKKFDINDNFIGSLFDYDLNSHSFLVGITF